MDMGDDLILMVERRMVFWMMMTSTSNTVMAVSMTTGGGLVTLVVWLSFNIMPKPCLREKEGNYKISQFLILFVRNLRKSKFEGCVSVDILNYIVEMTLLFSFLPLTALKHTVHNWRLKSAGEKPARHCEEWA